MLEKHNFRLHCFAKTLATGESQQRNEQFETIDQLKQSYQALGNPVMSMDTKKKLIGHGYVY
ncbi:ISAzo13-like element transposase-related protein [Nostoc sp.]|uniref:ISAzo13-like element transposase-related protein n=1 Tax=Nostoc sp. TaxID=1180 RepID=UPI003FA5DEB2